MQWLLLDEQNLSQQETLHIEVLSQYINTQQIFPLSSQSMDLLPTDIASGFLPGDLTAPKIYSLVTTILLERSGCLEIRAVVTSEGDTDPIYQGSLVISTR